MLPMEGTAKAEEVELQTGAVKTKEFTVDAQKRQERTTTASLQMQQKWLVAQRRIASLEAQVNMHRLREEALVCEIAELRKNHEICQTKFDEERREWLRSMRNAQASVMIQSTNNDKADVEILKAEIAELKSSLADAERTRQFLLEDNGKIKQQKAKLRCDYNELKREHSKLLASEQGGTRAERNIVLRDRSGSENVPNCVGQNGPRDGNNFGTAVLGLSETCSVYIPPVPPVQSSDPNIAEREVNSGCDGNPGAEPVNMQEVAGTQTAESAGDRKLIEELTEKLKHSNEKNNELRKALHIVDEQCEKLVKSFQELKLRLQLEAGALIPGTSSQGSGYSGQSVSKIECLEVEKNRMLLFQKLTADESVGSSAVKRKNESCLTAFGKRPKKDS